MPHTTVSKSTPNRGVVLESVNVDNGLLLYKLLESVCLSLRYKVPKNNQFKINIFNKEKYYHP